MYELQGLQDPGIQIYLFIGPFPQDISNVREIHLIYLSNIA